MSAKQKFLELTKLFRVSFIEFLLAGLVMSAIVYKALTDMLAEKYNVTGFLYDNQQFFSDKIWSKLNTPLMADFVSVFYWSVIGLVLFSLTMSLISVIVDIKNDIENSRFFVHPTSFHQSDFWLAAISRRVIKITAYALVIFYITSMMRGAPFVYESIRAMFAVNGMSLTSTAPTALLVSTTWFFGWHMLVVFRRLELSLVQKLE